MTNALKKNFKIKNLIQKLKSEDIFYALINSGILPSQWYDYSSIEEVFIFEYKKTDSKMQAYENTALVFNCSSEKIRKVVAKLNEKVDWQKSQPTTNN